MRSVRLVAVALTLALLGLLPAGATSQAAAPAPHQGVVARKTTERKITASIRTTDGQLVMTGTVTPPKGPVIVQMATRCNMAKGECNFVKWRVDYLDGGTKYSVKVTAPDKGNLYWRAHVGTNMSPIWVTCKTTKTSC